MSAKVVICNGCCCGRIAKGNKEVPIDALKSAWIENNLEDTVKLTISGCLGPCSMNNVAFVKTESGRTWLGKLNQDQHYEALVGWACDIAQNGKAAVMPHSLEQHCFDAKDSQVLHTL